MGEFRSAAELREVLDRVFTMLSEDPKAGPRLRDADAPLRLEITDLDEVVNIGPGSEDGPNLVWEWTDDVAWTPRAELRMGGAVVNRFCLGRLNIPMAIARRQVRIGGNRGAALALVPALGAIPERYAAMLRDDYPHLLD